MFKKNILLLLLITTCLNCKKKSRSNENLHVNDEIKSQNVDFIKLIKNDTITSKNNKQKELSFVISCGSGCALTYNEESRGINNSNYEINFTVQTYINDALSEEFDETYVFEFDSLANVLKSIHLKDKKENIVLNEDLLVRPELIKIANTFFSNRTNSLSQNKIKLFEENEPYKRLSLPFDSKDFVQKKLDIGSQKYEPSSFLIEYLIKKGYEGEEYGCYFLNSDSTSFIVSISRGDSQYFLLIKANQKSILSYDEIGTIGGEDTLYFKINPSLIISTYNLNNVEVKKYKI